MNRATGSPDYDVLVIGSGFAGSVAALRLTEKGYRVGVLEAGRRFEDADFPCTSGDACRFFWAPKLGCLGIQQIHLLRNVIILAGAGVGGGSLVYANTLYEPDENFYHTMQTLGNSITVRAQRTWRGRIRLTSRPGHGAANPT